MVHEHRVELGDLTGNPFQGSGKHRDNEMPNGIGLIPHGDRNRAKPQYDIEMVVDRDSDPNIRRI
jgi:hypothetical protein